LGERPRSLSDLTVRSEGKSGLIQFCCSFEANSWLFNEEEQQNWAKPAFPQ
jgi:hypothetical protein